MKGEFDAICNQITVIKKRISEISGKPVCSYIPAGRGFIKQSRGELDLLVGSFEKIVSKSVARLISPRCTIEVPARGYKQVGGQNDNTIFGSV